MPVPRRAACRPPLAGLALALALGGPAGCGSGLEPRPANAASPTDSAPERLSLARNELASAERSEAVVERAPARLPPYTPEPGDELDPHQGLEDPSGVALDYFYRALTDADEGRPGAMVRVLHLGDSTLGLDGVPQAIRAPMQRRFGDGGPGLVLLKRYSPSYKPASVKLRGGEGWAHCYIAFKCRADGRYGLGGVIVSAASGASTAFVSRFSTAELWYAASPGGGKIELELDGKLAAQISSKISSKINSTLPPHPQRGGEPDPSMIDRWETLAVEPGLHTLEVSAAGGGKARLYGVVLENEGPGVVWDATSMIGAFTKRLLAWDAEHIAAQVRHRDPALIVLSYGGNDLRRIAAGTLDEDGYVAEAGAVIDRVRAGKPEASCLLTGVIDHARSGTYEIEAEHVATMIGAQRRAAAEKGCAFFDSWTAMGGPNSIRAWLRASPRLAEPDLKHLNSRGQALMGRWIHDALLAGYVAYRRRGLDTRPSPQPSPQLSRQRN